MQITNHIAGLIWHSDDCQVRHIGTGKAICKEADADEVGRIMSFHARLAIEDKEKQDADSKKTKGMTVNTFKIHLCNTQTIGARCGYGIGETREDAIADALRIARQRDPDAAFDKQSGTVCFRGGINC